MTRDTYIRGVEYELGESTRGYQDASGFRDVVEGKKLPELPDLWGWGSFHVTANPYELGRKAAQKALAAAAVDPATVELTIFACSYFPDADDLLYQSTGKLLKELKLVRSLLDGQTLMGCATLLSAVQAAVALVSAGVHRNVLVIGLDKMPSGIPRFWDYGLFSDAAAACVVTCDRSGGCLRVVGSTRGVELEEIVGGVRFNASNALYIRVLNQLVGQTACPVPQISRVFNNNVYLPIKSQKDQLAGFKKPQMFLDNVARTGHCLACDSLINFHDYAASHRLAAGERFLFQADGNGCCAMSLLQWEGE
jgi:3-oxoacyl-[acyl-carrier-protein] synthase-3